MITAVVASRKRQRQFGTFNKLWNFCDRPVRLLKGKKGKGRYNSSWESHLRATGCHLPYGITQCYLPPDTSERAPPNPSHTGWYSIYLPRRDGRLSWPSWLDRAPAGSRTSDLSITSPTPNRCTTKTTGTKSRHFRLGRQCGRDLNRQATALWAVECSTWNVRDEIAARAACICMDQCYVGNNRQEL